MLDARGEYFLTIDHVPTAVLASEGRDPRGVAAGFGLGNGHRLQAQPAGRDLGQVAALLRLTAMAEQRPHGVHLGMTDGRVPAGGVDLLEHDAGLHETEPGAAVFRGDQDRQPAAVGQGANEFVRIALLGVGLAPVRVRKRRADGAHAVAVRLLLGAQVEVHQGCVSRKIARARLTTASSTISPSRV